MTEEKGGPGATAVSEYSDRLITIRDATLAIRRYYFPFATTKTIPLRAIKSARELELGPMTGRWRFWGSSGARQWFNLDPSRRHKTNGIVFDVGKKVEPVVTPDDPAAFRKALAANGVQIVDSP